MVRYIVILAYMVVLLIPSTTQGSSRKTPWLYGTRTMTKGEVEYEQWVTWRTNKASDSAYDEIRIRHEIEWGATDNLQFAFYFADWRYKRTSATSDTFFHDVAFEAIYQLQAPSPGQLGVAIYGEIKYGSEFLELEGKLLLEYEVDQLSYIYNLTIEAEWEGKDFHEDKGKIENAFAIMYQPDPTITYGVQALWQVALPDWDRRGDNVVSIGPSVSWQSGGWWMSISPLFQVTSVDSEPDLQVRFMFGIDF